MNRDQSYALIQQTFTQGFDRTRFLQFIRNLVNHLDESKAAGMTVPDAFTSHIRNCQRLGTYRSPEGELADVLIVYTTDPHKITRTRTALRDFVAHKLKRQDSYKEAGLIAFVSPDARTWRFSYIRMEYETKRNPLTGKIIPEERLTPARRFSYIVGEGESCHTAQTRFLSLLQDTKTDPNLADIEEAFSVEAVTREFFKCYVKLFESIHQALEELITQDKSVSDEFQSKNINSVDFAKKLMGQIVFLYFLQKKGWLGVEKGQDWGTGPHDFLRRLAGGEYGAYENYFNDVLKPLFYDTLATDRGHEAWSSHFKCRIPFLNGGLFEPLGGYDWRKTDIILPNRLFANADPVEGDIIGTGVLDVFDRYNFTVNEAEPLEKEVAIDPEMLGKVFENLIEENRRKGLGAYYTPREIVHYMCRESLINYLDTALNTVAEPIFPLKPQQSKLFGEPEPEQMTLRAVTRRERVPREDIETFIHTGDQAAHYEAARMSGTKSYKPELPEGIETHARLLDEKLQDITVCDPAVGSGAFPVGMMTEIVRARSSLTPYFNDVHERTPYFFKRHAIQNCLYGVDIDPGAIEIAKLRLWLSLVVDEEDVKQIKPLPNLDYKIVCGNSLFNVEKDLFNADAFKQLELLKPRFFDETDDEKKKTIKNQIDRLIGELTHGEKQFDFEIMFSEVFHKTQGFDAVIANPPYVRQESIKDFKPRLKQTFGAFYCGTADLYTYFYKRGLDILKASGHLCFIAPNKFMRAGYGKNTRALLAGEATPKIVIDFGDLPIFDATTYPSILLVGKNLTPSPSMGKGLGGGEFLAATFTDPSQLERIDETLAAVGFTMPVAALKPEGWTLERPDVLALMEKLRKAGKPLGEYVQGRFYRGVLTGLNEAFVIDKVTRRRLIAEDPKSADLIKPWLRGRDIRKWKAEWAGLYVIFTRRGTDIEQYPAIKRHLEQFRIDLEPKKSDSDERGRKPGTYKWFEIQDNIAYFEEFDKPKITWRHFTTVPEFIYDESAYFSNDKSYILPTDDLALLGILNSRVTNFFIGQISPPVRGGFMEMRIIFMEQLPIPSATDAQKTSIIERVRNILADPDSPAIPQLEAEIDQLVYELYGLTDEEIGVVNRRE